MMRHTWWLLGGSVELDDLRRLQAAPVVGKVGYRMTVPGNRAKAIETVRRAAHVYAEWCCERFGALDGWKPAASRRPKTVWINGRQ